MSKQYDEYQQKAISLASGQHLVLAPPGCGKTDILAERIVRAHAAGVPYGEMLCLTFTNRAAKGMSERIADRTLNPVSQELFVGNVHRFCSNFLFDIGAIPRSSAIIDDVDTDSIIQEEISANATQKVYTLDLVKLQHTCYQLAHGYPGDLVLHSNLLKAGSFFKLYDVLGLPYEDTSAAYIYTHIEDLVKQHVEFAQSDLAQLLLMAKRYEIYKEENDLLDFDDLLVFTYDYASAHTDTLRRYSWIQVDEVQDLNPLQFAIIDFFTAPAESQPTVVYLGDEQQAIFSFIGAKMETIEWLKQRCRGHICYLYRNYRSPKYLLDVLNQYATNQLGIRRDLLPVTDNDPPHAPSDLCLLDVGDGDYEADYAVSFARRYGQLDPQGQVAILVATNREADEIGAALQRQQVPHFKISGTDLFSSHEVRTLIAHLTVVTDESVFIAWARLLWYLGVIDRYSRSRDFMRKLKQLALVPTDFLSQTTYLSRFARDYAAETFVIFDTETTGLDVFHDDIIQIAAVKVRNGEVVSGSEFDIILETSREIPPEVGGHPNPMLEVYRKSKRLSRTEGLRRFIDYCQGHILVGHNVNYDYRILHYNLQQACPDIDLQQLCPHYYDTLKVAHLVEPRLRMYKLGHLLETFHLEGENSHRADDDILATKAVMDHCYQLALPLIAAQQEFLANPSIQKIVERFRQRYTAYYRHTQARLYESSVEGRHPILVDELQQIYDMMCADGRLQKVEKFHYMVDYLSQDLIDARRYPTLVEQLGRYITDLSTCREADLCGSSSMRDRFFVSTIHKAKGLEFDTVIVYHAIEGVYPFTRSWTETQIQEDARKLYVALSRAKRRLCVTYNSYQRSSHHELTHFMRFVRHHFQLYRRDPATGKILEA